MEVSFIYTQKERPFPLNIFIDSCEIIEGAYSIPIITCINIQNHTPERSEKGLKMEVSFIHRKKERPFSPNIFIDTCEILEEETYMPIITCINIRIHTLYRSENGLKVEECHIYIQKERKTIPTKYFR